MTEDDEIVEAMARASFAEEYGSGYIGSSMIDEADRHPTMDRHVRMNRAALRAYRERMVVL